MYRRIRNLLTRNGINATIKYCIKTFDSYFEKLLRLHNTNESVIITDILGFRIICPFWENIENLEKLINANFSVIEEERKGIKRSLKMFGYDSIHLLIDLPPNSLAVRIPNTEKVCEI